MYADSVLLTVLAVPLITALVCYLTTNIRLNGYVSLTGSLVLVALSVPLIAEAGRGELYALDGLLFMDALSAYVMALVVLLAAASAGYSIGYIEHEHSHGLTDARGVRRYYALLHLFVLTMLLVTVSNNLALLWMSVEATTIVSAVLIGLGFYKRELAIEAAWKYIILCTVGITFALLGTFIAYYAAITASGGYGTLEWTELKKISSAMNPETMKLAFIFILLGYGTKAGLAPVHNWLPDAHSMAPSPVSALLSGILLNTAFYGIIRFTAIVNPSTGSAFTGNLLLIFGLISLGVAAVFILVQDNYKRLLAYSSIEHMGIISIGTGIGGVAGIYGALLHILNHALAKPLMFFVSGKIQSKYGSTQIEKVRGVLSSMPFLGTMSFIGLLALTGTPPLNIFLSEFTILKAGIDKGHWLTLFIMLVLLATVFFGMLSG